ncbi:hypothetical protein GWI33_022630 [Rhynchophorus ferrugineus]|uniref:Protein shuttle craft n=1 Tax=Rhynchophorus ferrugineus TaxID=354439 RepID=A0A834J089_RHYFE|nr:hypothetical protein GWI33_022630 [Rhynchophorus ferrugineus]
MSHTGSNEASSSTMSNVTEFRQNEVSFVSNLQPTAPEYIPSSSRSKTGAVKKTFTRHNRNVNKIKMSKLRLDEMDNRDSDELSTTFPNSTDADDKKQHDKKLRYDRKSYYKYNGYQEDRKYNNYEQEKNDNHVTVENVGFYNKRDDYGYTFDKKDRYSRPSSKYDRFSQRSNYRDRQVSSRIYNSTRFEDYHHSRKKQNDFNHSNNRNKQRNGKHETLPVEILKDANIAGQRERLIDMIDCYALECLVCCDKIRNNDKTWSCLQCFHILHLNCVIAWVKSSKVEENWRCPACQNLYTESPSDYRCYCGKMKGKNCDHKCNILCHPGPCPECNVMVSKPCGCGATQQVVKCSSEQKFVCNDYCKKLLNCGMHTCTEKCHTDDCKCCQQVLIQECYCGKTGRKVPCNAEHQGNLNFGCDNLCGKLLSCTNHKCMKLCHSGPCNECDKDIHLVKYCCCGKTLLKEERKSCLDPVPCCKQVCDKLLKCGHYCKEVCHEGKCPTCPLKKLVRCRCGNLNKEVTCDEFINTSGDVICEKKCTKKRLCGKHKCNQKCCIEIEHICMLSCNRLLTCGIHRCERTCHSGRCPPCLETSFEELYCECGFSVVYPPVPCGTKPPMCPKPCSKSRTCGHPPNHECHPGSCPPCFVLTKKWCYGNHEERSTIPCNQENFSCGLPCGKPMPCGYHKCIKPCHDGECPQPCIQPCLVPRNLCGHPCNKPCHKPPCPESNCKSPVLVTCQCGLQKGTKICLDLLDEYMNLEMAQIKDKIDQNGDILLANIKPNKVSAMKVLECNDECKIYERNRRLAIGLQIRNPDLSQKLTPRYSDFLKQWAKKDPKFCQRIHEKLTELVQLAKQSKQKSRSHSFESMNRDKRHFIHEYCEYFGVDSEAYDKEPNRNVVATAIKDKSWLPSMSLLEVFQRENGQRKVPGPILGYGATTYSESVSLKALTKTQK